MLNVDNDGRGFEMISLELLSEENSLDVYAFEKENREYFERNLPPRPANYFDLEGFKEKAFTTYGFNRIIAGTATGNLASQRVLLKNGFTFSRMIENDLQIHNEWVHTAIFEIRRP